MEKQAKLKLLNERSQKIEPEVKVIRNTYMGVRSLIKEEIIKKVWIVPI